MTTAPESTSTQPARRTAHVPRPLPGWLQAGVVLLLIVQGLQTISHRNEPSATAPSTAPLARFAYTYQPDGVRVAGNMQPAFPYAGYYAHAPSAMKVTPYRAYDSTPGRWVDRDPLPANSGLHRNWKQ